MQVQKKEIQDTILRKSQELFLLKGYKKTTLSEISYLSGISKGNIYNYFKSKNDIFSTLIFDAEEKLAFVLNFLSTNSFVGAENLRSALLSILFEHILPVKDGIILLYDREVEEGAGGYVSDLLNIINNMNATSLVTEKNRLVLEVISGNLVKGYIDILKSNEPERVMKEHIVFLTDYHVGGLAYLKQRAQGENDDRTQA